MKKNYVLVLLIIGIPFVLMAQKKQVRYSSMDDRKQKYEAFEFDFKPVYETDDVINEYIKREIGQLVLTTNNANSGLNIDLGKNEVKASVNLKSKQSIRTLDIVAGLDEKGIFSFLNNEKINSKFSAVYNWHFIPKGSWNKPDFSTNTYEIKKAEKDINKKIADLKTVEDELLAMAIIMKSKNNNGFMSLKEIINIHKRNQSLNDVFDFADKFLQDNKFREAFNKATLVKMINKYGKNISVIDLEDMLIKAPLNYNFDIDKLYDDFKTKILEVNDKERMILDLRVGKLKTLSTGTGNKAWFTFSPSVGLQPTDVFKTDKSLTKTAVFALGVSANYNFLQNNSNRFILNRLNVSLGRGNNLGDLNAYAYTKTKTNFKSDTLSIVYQDKKTAYEKDKIDYGLSFNVGFEHFGLNKDKRIGGWFTTNFNYNATREIKWNLPTEVGMVIKLNDRQDKTVYLLPYIGFLDLLHLSSDADKLKIFKKDWFLGVKFGLPFNIN